MANPWQFEVGILEMGAQGMSTSSKRVNSTHTANAADPDLEAPIRASTRSAEYSLSDSVAYQLRVTYKCFIERLQPLLEKHGIPLGMWYYLRVLWEEDGLTQREISTRVGLVAPTTVEQLRKMEERALLVRHRNARDRRKIHVFLTPKARALKSKLLPIAPFLNRLAVQGLSPAEIGLLRMALARMQKNLLRDLPDVAAAVHAGRSRSANKRPGVRGSSPIARSHRLRRT